MMMPSRTFFVHSAFGTWLVLQLSSASSCATWLLGEAHFQRHNTFNMTFERRRSLVCWIFCIINFTVFNDESSYWLQVKSENNGKPAMFMTITKHVNSLNKLLVYSIFFTNRFTDGNTSHGRIGYAGRILSKIRCSQDTACRKKNKTKLSSCSIRAQNNFNSQRVEWV